MDLDTTAACITLILAPSSVRNIQATNISTHSIEITWYTPVEHKECINHYKLCYLLLPGQGNEGPFNESCIETPEVTDYALPIVQQINNLEPCAKYRIIIAPVTHEGKLGRQSMYEASTAIEPPGEPQNFQVVKIQGNKIHLGWNRPVKNPWCVQRYGFHQANKLDDNL